MNKYILTLTDYNKPVLGYLLFGNLFKILLNKQFINKTRFFMLGVLLNALQKYKDYLKKKNNELVKYNKYIICLFSSTYT